MRHQNLMLKYQNSSTFWILGQRGWFLISLGDEPSQIQSLTIQNGFQWWNLSDSKSDIEIVSRKMIKVRFHWNSANFMIQMQPFLSKIWLNSSYFWLKMLIKRLGMSKFIKRGQNPLKFSNELIQIWTFSSTKELFRLKLDLF